MASQPTPSRDEIKRRKVHVGMLCLALDTWYSHFKADCIRESLLEEMDTILLKRVKEKSVLDNPIKEYMGLSTKVWDHMVRVSGPAVQSLEKRCYTADLLSGENITAYDGPSSNAIVANSVSLLKDLYRLDQMVQIARNIITTGETAQNLAAQAAFDREVCDLINFCVKITARGYDGDGTSVEEDKWQGVINGFKQLLITCLQFLNNFVVKNERLSLLLWVELFDGSIDSVANIEALDYSLRNLQASRNPKEWLTSVKTVFANQASISNQKISGDQKDLPPKPAKPITPYFMFLEKHTDKIKEELKATLDEPTIAEVMSEATKRWNELPEEEKATWRQTYRVQLEEFKQNLVAWHAAVKIEGDRDSDDAAEIPGNANVSLPPGSLENGTPSHRSSTRRKPNDASSISESTFSTPVNNPNTEGMESAADGAKRLAEGKSQLLKRLETANVDRAQNHEGNSSSVQSPSSSHNHVPESLPSGAEEEESDDESSDDDDYALPGEDGRGLLTDVPLILGPNEIEVLPMIISTGVVAPGRRYPSAEEAAQGPDLHTIRCHLLLAQENGRNLLRELLIFVAAWDLREEELYFKFMVLIIESMLMNGLLPFAYNAFKESKDIISPAQAVIMKLLTKIFQTRQAYISVPRLTSIPPDQQVTLDASSSHGLRVDIQVVHALFSEFRQSIIPQICALIFLQGQIRLGHANLDDFPLNLWDMERMYEGVYQYLEFFAVLTEEDTWKGMMADWEVVSELVTLLRELELAIPKTSQASSSSSPLPPPPPPLNRSKTPTEPNGNAAKQPTADEAIDAAVESPYDANGTDGESHPPPSPYPEPLHDEPADFEWRNLKKLCVLVLSSLVWKNKRLQDQVRNLGGIAALLSCCAPVDEHNPSIREHAIMCLRFLMEGNEKNQEIMRELAAASLSESVHPNGTSKVKVPEEVLDPKAYETFIDLKGQVCLRRKDATVEHRQDNTDPMVPIWMQSILKNMQEPR